MNAAEIKELYTATPFRPFELVLPNGSAVLIPHPEFMMFSLDHRTIHVAQPEGGAKRIDVKLVTAINELPESKSRRKK
jgi:hypothetical protein